MEANNTAHVESSLLGFTKSIFQSAAPSLVSLIFVPIITFWLWIITSYLSSPLKKYPGPFLGRFTRLWYMYQVSTGDSHLILEKLHKKYGPIVRITPSIIDVDIPEIIKSIFNTKDDWLKTPFYHGSSALVSGQIVLNLFSQTDPVKHRKERKPIAKFYSTAGVTTLEPHIDKVIDQLCGQLEERFMEGNNFGKICDIGQWILFYKNPICHIGPPGFNTITGISVKHLVDRYQGNDKDYHDPEQPDFLDKFIEVKNANPEEADDAQIISWLMVNMIAGADTTAITIRSALYFGLKHPECWQRLTDEILAADFGDEVPAYKHVKGLPYTDALIREALRMLPGVSMTMERYVPKEGFTLPNGDFIPGGTILGMNPYILARNKSVYGEDAAVFRPERWLQSDGEDKQEYEKRLLMMNEADLSFGGGSRICIGKNMGLFQTYKVLARLITLYEIELADPRKEWKVINSWFPRQEGLRVRLRKRVA
ncbi:unnamed protein product [Fusarium equiseti]|uniref:Pisatin demethylase n=1 Tax=Fusarium equiseti TaxID=61235 RepID=A0A8J2ITE8_FUSEQ|nr:unnamed protein product [Fusarium equiseti]